MNLSDNRLLSLWQDEPAWAPTLAQLRGALGLRANAGRDLGRLLDNLVDRGALERDGKRFRRPAPRDAGRRDPPARRDARPTDGERQKHGPRQKHGQRTAQGEPKAPLGVFSAHPNGFGFVELTGSADALFIPPPAIAGALDGDLVRAERQEGRGRQRTAGRIVEVVERRHPRIRGRLQHEGQQSWVEPLNAKLPLVFISEGDPPAWPDGTVVELALTHYPRHHDEAPEGRIVQAFTEDAEAPEQVVLHILSDLALTAGFSAETQSEMARMRLPALEPGQGREDLRHLPFVTIDGEDARDFDDAVCLETLRGGRRRLWVAIADVAAYVTPGTAVDRDAWAKGTSVYFPNQVFPMLPERLSNDLCSLRPEEPRLTLTCEMELGADGERLGHRIYESVIRSRARLTYNRVQRLFDEEAPGDLSAELATMLGAMRQLAADLRARREARGALDFSFPEFKFELGPDGWPRAVRETWATEATRLIEQFMLEANETVAEHCADEKLPILYRVHDPPPPDALKSLEVTLLNFGVELKPGGLTRPGALQALVDRVRAHPPREQVEVAILRSLSQAQYRSHNDGHFALAASHYAHFTSPIRRYPDLLLHRALKASLGRPRRRFTLPEDAGLRCSVTERTAGEAEGRVVRLYKVLYMEPRLGETFAATVSSASDRGLWLRLRDEPVDGLLPLDALPIHARYDRDRNRLVATSPGRRSRGTHGRGEAGAGFGIGDRVRVTLARADRLSQQLDFAWNARGWGDDDQGAPAKPGGQSRSTAKPRPTGKPRPTAKPRLASKPRPAGKPRPAAKSGAAAKASGRAKTPKPTQGRRGKGRKK